MKQWKKYTGYETWDQSYSGEQSYFPGPLDTSNLFAGTESHALKEHLMEELDYSLVPESAWNKLVVWYGVSDTSRPVARTVVEYGLYMKHCKVEVYLLNFKLSLHPKLSETVTKSFSRADTVAELEKELRHTFNVEEKTVCRVWHRYMSHTYELLSDSNQTLQDAGLYNMQTIVLECQKEDGSWPRATTQASYQATHSTRSQDSITGSTSSSAQSTSSYRSGGGGSYWSGSYSQQPTHPGLCGLSNLGNTCFMNSALQCLSNTEPLTEYFTGGAYKKHINKKNPLGMQGQVAETYGTLLDDMWSGNSCSTCSPRQFKTVVGRFAPQFSGYQQQDSHELLAFLLDGLHEDLNLVLKKPYVDMSVKTEGREEKDIAEESWYKYLQRNQSVVVKVFQGQLKSTLVCPQCSMLSKTFDPFMYLSLPLPVKKTRKMEVIVVYADPNKPMVKYSLIVPKRGTISHLKTEVSEQTEIPDDMMVVVDVYNSRFHRVYDNKENISHILDRDDIYVYELSHQVGDKDWVHVPIYHRELVVKKVNYGYSYTQRYHNLFGLPTIIRVPRNTSTYDTVYQAVLARCSREV
ncbi:Ubiquitin carboxyl-terminal hydrolase 4 [Geodia barretti]|nr:Ubiquitin carboxyl-terminal hydrolase 4 [Geodia barretti]